MKNQIQFETPEDFRKWLQVNCLSNEGIWLVFGKEGGPKTLTANEALEEALCFGWIDSQIKSIDDKTYIKYFAQRRKNTEWSAKNIALAEQLEAAGRMTDFGRAKIDEAKQNNCFKAKERLEITEDHINQFIDQIKNVEPAYSNFLGMSPSVKRVYASHYFDAKSEEVRIKRLHKIVERLNQNLKPM
ncbi:MAG: YdeI/OmpD-associated family protein [Bacillota bacterium]